MVFTILSPSPMESQSLTYVSMIFKVFSMFLSSFAVCRKSWKEWPVISSAQSTTPATWAFRLSIRLFMDSTICGMMITRKITTTAITIRRVITEEKTLTPCLVSLSSRATITDSKSSSGSFPSLLKRASYLATFFPALFAESFRNPGSMSFSKAFIIGFIRKARTKAMNIGESILPSSLKAAASPSILAMQK